MIAKKKSSLKDLRKLTPKAYPGTSFAKEMPLVEKSLLGSLPSEDDSIAHQIIPLYCKEYSYFLYDYRAKYGAVDSQFALLLYIHLIFTCRLQKTNVI